MRIKLLRIVTQMRGLHHPRWSILVIAWGAVGVALFVLAITSEEFFVAAVGGVDRFVRDGTEVVFDFAHLAW